MDFSQDEIRRFQARRQSELQPFRQQQQTQPTAPQGTSGRGGFLTSLISEAAGTGAAALATPFALAAAPFTLGASLAAIPAAAFAGSTVGRGIENKVRDDQNFFGEGGSARAALTEGGISGALSIPGAAFQGLKGLKALKAVKPGAKALGIADDVAKAGSKVVSSVDDVSKLNFTGGTVAKKSLGGRLRNTAEDKAAAKFLNLTPAQTANLLDAGVDPTTLAKTAAQFGDDAASIIGRTGKGGPLQQTIKGLESGIQSTAKTAGSNVRLDSSSIIKALKAERRQLARGLGSESKVKALDKIIADATKKYAKGSSVNQALTTLRTANSKFGASILDDSTEAVAKSAQKLEANALRTVLKDRFPGIRNALDKQGELIQLREVLSKSRGKDLASKVNLGQFSVLRPGTLASPIVNSPKVTGAILRGGPSLPNIPGISQGVTATGTGLQVGRKLAPGIIGRGLVGVEQQAPLGLDDALAQQGQQGFGLQDGTDPTQPGFNQTPSLQDGTSGPLDQQTRQPVSQNPYPRENLLFDVQRDPANAEEYIKQFQLFQEVFAAPESEGLDLNNTAIQSISDTQAGLDQLAKLQTTFETSGANNPVIGRLRGLNPFDTEAQSFDSQLRLTRQIIGKALEGGVLRKEDEAKYSAILPNAGDTDATAVQKLQTIQQDIQSKLDGYIQNQRIFGGGGGSLENALMQQGAI